MNTYDAAYFSAVALTMFIPFQSPRWIVWVAARVPHKSRRMVFYVLRFFVHIFGSILFFWLVSLVVRSLLEVE